jgi:hypothetical protein
VTPTTQHLVRNLSNLLARGGGAVVGLSMVFLAMSDPINWNWLRGIGLGTGAALLGVVLIRYIPYGPAPSGSPLRERCMAKAAEIEEIGGPDWKLLAWPISGFLIGLVITGGLVLYLIHR